MTWLGKQARDKITGFSGIITAQVRYITGCDQFCISPPVKDGEIKSGQYFDFLRIEIIGDGIEMKTLDGQEAGIPSGGPNRDVPSR